MGSPSGSALGRVGRAHGRDGSFYVEGPARTFEVGDAVVLGGRERGVERRAGTEERPILRVAGVGDRSAATVLRGEYLLDPSPPSLEEGEWPVEELVGCHVEGLGTVRRVIAAPSCDVLEVGEAQVLVPLIRDAVTRVDPAARLIEVDHRFLGFAGSGGGRASTPSSGSDGARLAAPETRDGPNR